MELVGRSEAPGDADAVDAVEVRSLDVVVAIADHHHPREVRRAEAQGEDGHEGGGHGEGGTLPEGVTVTVDGRDITSTDPAESLPKIAGCSFEVTVSGLATDPPDAVGIRIIAWPPTAPEENKVVLVDVTEESADGSWAGSYPLDEAVEGFKRVGNGYHMRFGIVHVDYATQQRFIKRSGQWFAMVTREHGVSG